MVGISSLDKRILRILVENGRMTASEIAEKIGAASSTVRGRIRRLEQLGIITGYAAMVDRKKLGFGLEAIVQVELTQTRSYAEFLARLRDVEEVVEFVVSTGPVDALVTVWARDADHLGHLLDRLSSLPGVDRNTTFINLYKESRPGPVEVSPDSGHRARFRMEEPDLGGT